MLDHMKVSSSSSPKQSLLGLANPDTALGVHLFKS
jgi:hypothetical protein